MDSEHGNGSVDGAPRYPVARAFLVQFSREADAAQGIVPGRVEHISSGRSMRFATVDDLLAFVCEVTSGEEPCAARAE